jgi:glycerophosphoryl diester phosphodiesterase
MLILGHRGSPHTAPENTVVGFRAALEEGADGVELDLRLTADGHLVCVHDTDLERTTDGGGPVSRFTLAELRRLDAGARFAVGDRRPFAGRDVRIPTLEEALEAVPAPHLVDLEVKANRSTRLGPASTDLVEALAAALGGRADRDRLFVSTFSRDLAAVLVPAIAPVPVGLVTTTFTPIGRAARAARAAGCRILAANEGAYRWPGARAAAARALAAGCTLVAWTVDEPSAMRRLASVGVSVVISNHPGALRAPA